MNRIFIKHYNISLLYTNMLCVVLIRYIVKQTLKTMIRSDFDLVQFYVFNVKSGIRLFVRIWNNNIWNPFKTDRM